MRALALISILLLASAVNAEVFRWQDANGNTVFGDSPPDAARAEAVDLPPLTVADSYNSNNKKDGKQTATDDGSSENETGEQNKTVKYTRFALVSPEKDKAIRANNGNVMVRLALEPALQPGHGIVVYLDGKQVAKGDATVFSLENVDRGRHSVFAVLHNAKDDVLKNTEAVSFNLLRKSILN